MVFYVTVVIPPFVCIVVNENAESYMRVSSFYFTIDGRIPEPDEA